MADILTQLQTCLDQLATQFYATLSYITTYHDHSPAPPPANVPNALWKLEKIPKNAPPATPSASAADAAPSAETTTSTGAAQGDARGGDAQPATGTTSGQAGPRETETEPPGPPRPDSPNTFQSRQRELARDLIIKEQQIEYLVSVLPGIESSEKQQEERIKQLAEELRVVEAQRRRKRREMAKLREKVDGLLGAVSRGTGISS